MKRHAATALAVALALAMPVAARAQNTQTATSYFGTLGVFSPPYSSGQQFIFWNGNTNDLALAPGDKFATIDGVQTFTHKNIDCAVNICSNMGGGGGGAATNGSANDILTSNGLLGFGAPITPAAGVAALLGSFSSANMLTALGGSHTGTGSAVFSISPALTTPDLGIPSAANLVNATNLPIGSTTGNLAFGRLAVTGSPTGLKFVRDDGVLAVPAGAGGGSSAGAAGNIQTSLDGAGAFGSFVPGAGITTFLTTPSSANLLAALTTKTGTGLAVFGTSPTLLAPTFTGPALGTIASGDLTAATNVPMSAALGTLLSPHGGTGQTSYTDGQLLIGNTGTGGLNKAALIQGANVTITNGPGTITIAATTGSATAGGSNGQIQVNSGGALAGRTIGTGLLDDGTNFGLTSVANDQSTGGYALLTGDASKTVLVGAFTYTIPQAGSAGFGSGWSGCLLNIAAGNATVTTTTSVFKGAGGATSMTLRPKSWACPASDGTNYQTVFGSVDGGDLTAGTVTNAALATMPTHTFKGNNTGGTAAVLDLTRAQMVADLFDSLSSTQGAVLYRGAATWTALAPGTNGQTLTSAGPAANPTWTTPAGSGNMIGSGASTSGNLLQSNNTGGTLGTATDTGIAASSVLTASSTTALSNKTLDCTTSTCNNFPRTLNYGWIPTVNPNEDVIYTVAAGATTVTMASIRGTVVAPVGASATVQFNKAADGAACSAGSNLATGTFDANGTANTNQTLTLIGSPTLAVGDRICVITTGSGWTSGVGRAGITFTLRVL